MEAMHPAWLVLFSVFLALVPVLTGVATSYLKCSIVLSLFRSGLGAQQVPGNLVIMVLSLALTTVIMQPVVLHVAERSETVPVKEILENPSTDGIIKIVSIFDPVVRFMQSHAGQREMMAMHDLFVNSNPQRNERETLPIKGEATQPESVGVIAAAFVLSELKNAFSIGFVVLLPFLVVDLIVANVLVGMGMFMVSPVLIALPLKVLLFVVADGWLLLSKGLVLSYQL